MYVCIIFILLLITCPLLKPVVFNPPFFSPWKNRGPWAPAKLRGHLQPRATFQQLRGVALLEANGVRPEGLIWCSAEFHLSSNLGWWHTNLGPAGVICQLQRRENYGETRDLFMRSTSQALQRVDHQTKNTDIIQKKKSSAPLILWKRIRHLSHFFTTRHRSPSSQRRSTSTSCKTPPSRWLKFAEPHSCWKSWRSYGNRR